jgi:RHS repeat-associated protein
MNLEVIDQPSGNPVIGEEMEGTGLYLVTYDYTERSQLKHIYTDGWTFEYNYDPSGNVTTRQATYNDKVSSTNCPSDDYDALNRPRTWEQTSLGSRFSLSNYQYDRSNREVATWREEEDNRGERFTYEPTNQLATAAYNGHVANGPPSDATRTVTYAYTPDKLNRSSMVEVGGSGAVVEYSPNALNQYRSIPGHTYGYDSNFNLTLTEGFNGVYDAANRLVSASNGGSGEAHVTVAGFVYDGLGRCVKRTFNGASTVFVFDGWKPIAEWYESYPSSLLAWNLYGPGADEILLRQQGKIGYLRFHSDRHGNVAFILDENAEILEKYKYDAFGRPTVTDANGGNARSWSYYLHDFLFQGREYIHELEIYDYRNRFYLPATGRFLQSDPTGFGAGDMNLFRYVGDDPVDKADPLGLFDINLLSPWDPGHAAGDRAPLSNDRISIGGHGAPTYMNDSNGNRISAAKLAQIIRSNQKYNPRILIKMEVCCAGDFMGAAKVKGGVAYAQQLANELRTNPVSAHTSGIKLLDDGTTTFTQGYDKRFYGPNAEKTSDVVKGLLLKSLRQGGRPLSADGAQKTDQGAQKTDQVKPPEPLSQADWPDFMGGGSAGISHPPIQTIKSL